MGFTKSIAHGIAASILACTLLCLCGSACADTLTFSTQLKTIEAQAFMGDTSIEDVVLPEGVLRIESKAFSNSSIASVYLPDSLTYIAPDAFENTPESFSAYGSETGYAADFCAANGIPYQSASLSPSDFEYEVLEDGTARITSYSGSATIVYVPDEIDGHRVTAIGESVFKGNKTIQRVVLSQYIESLTANQFSGCADLISVLFTGKRISSIGRSLFNACVSLQRISLPQGMTEIPDSAFDGANQLVHVDFPDTLIKIGDKAFASCTSLVSADLPDTVESIGWRAFYHCTSLTSFHYPLNWKTAAPGRREGYIFAGDTLLASITVPEGIESIPAMAFDGSSYLLTVSLPSTLKTISSSAFRGCSSLTQLDFPNGLVSIEDNAFASCSSLVSADLPDTVENIGWRAFYHCTSLTSFHYPLNWKTAAPGRSQGYIFAGDTLLTSITVPEGIESIPAMAFDGSNCLLTVSLPSTLKTIPNAAFRGCSSLNDVLFAGTEEDWAAVFVGGNNTPLTNATFTYGSASQP